MEFFAVILLAIALSIDGFGVGMAYGMRNITFTILPIILITLCAAGSMTLSLIAGHLVASFIPYYLAGVIGGTILLIIGLWQLVEGLKKYYVDDVLLSIKLKMFGLVLQIIREPEHADMDKSGDINYREALVLGIALNMDVIGAGFGAGIAGYSSILIPIVSGALFAALLLGLILGERFSGGYGKKAYLLPGIILMLLGIFNMAC